MMSDKQQLSDQVVATTYYFTSLVHSYLSYSSSKSILMFLNYCVFFL